MPSVSFEDFEPTVRVPPDPAVMEIVARLDADRTKRARFDIATEKERKQTVRMLRRCAQEQNVTVRIGHSDDDLSLTAVVRDRQHRPRKEKVGK